MIDVLFNVFRAHGCENGFHSFCPCQFIELLTSVDTGELKNEAKSKFRIALNENLDFIRLQIALLYKAPMAEHVKTLTVCSAALCRYLSFFERWLIQVLMKFLVKSMGRSFSETRGRAFSKT